MTRGLFLTLVFALPAIACGRSTEGLDDAAKRQRIAEMYAEYRSDFPAAPEMSIEELLELGARSELVIVDARDEREQAVSMIPGALTRDEFEARAEELRTVPIVTYCTIGYRSGLFTEELRQRGFEAYNLIGSILAWTHSGQALENADGETRRVHVFGARWNLAADGFEAEW